MNGDKKMDRLNDKVIAIFGASGDIGSELARVFHFSGAKLSLVARGEEKLQVLASKLPDKGRVQVITADASNEEDLLRVFEEIVTRYDRLDVVVISVGTHDWLTIDSDPAEAREMFGKHFQSIFLPSAMVGLMAEQFFRAQGGGLILSISSHAAVRTDLPRNLSYAPMKAAARSFMLSLRSDLKDWPKVRITDLQPAIVNTPSNAGALDTEEKRRKAVQPEEIAEWIIEHFYDPKIPAEKRFDAKDGLII